MEDRVRAGASKAGSPMRLRNVMYWIDFLSPTKMLHLVAIASLMLLMQGFSAGQLRADYIPFNGAEVAPNIAEIRVGLDGISIQLEVFVEDIPQFEALVPDDWFKEANASRPDQSVRLSEFAETGLSVRRAGGQVLPVSIVAVEPRMRVDRTNRLSGQTDPMTGQRFPVPPADPRVLFVDLFYEFGDDQPDVVTISPPMSEEGIPAATIGMIAFDRDVPVTNFRYLSAQVTLNIDWDDPWFSRFDNPNLKRHHQSGVTTFIYVEPREVRHETLIRLRDLDPWLSLNLTSGDMLTSDRQNRIKQQAAEFLAQRNPVRIDGQNVMPNSVRTELLRLDPSGLQLLEGNAPVSADAAFLGVILSFPVSNIPDVVDVTWDMFNDRIVKVPATATDMAGPFLSGASPDDPLIVWNNHLLSYENPQVQPVMVTGNFYIPTLTVLGVFVTAVLMVMAWRTSGTLRALTGSAAVVALIASASVYDKVLISVRNPLETKPTDADAQMAFADLLAAIRVAHLEATPEARAKKIGTFAIGASLVDVSAELDRGLAIRVPGGGLARMAELGDVSLTEIQPAPEGYGFQALAEWSAIASAGHWGHSHLREVRYRALVEVLEEDGMWKLDGITVLEARTPDA